MLATSATDHRRRLRTLARQLVGHTQGALPAPAPSARALAECTRKQQDRGVSTPWGAVEELTTSDEIAFRSTLGDGPDADRCAEFFLEQGFLFVDDLLAGDALATAQSAYKAALEPERSSWVDAVQAGEAAGPGGSNTAPGRYNTGYFDLPRILEQHSCFLDIVTHPRIVSVLERVVGPEVQVLNVQCRNYPSQNLEVAQEYGAYSGWHNDRGYGVLFDNARSLHVVVIFTFFDVGVDGGCTAVVPQSHLMCARSPLLPCLYALLPIVYSFSIRDLLASRVTRSLHWACVMSRYDKTPLLVSQRAATTSDHGDKEPTNRALQQLAMPNACAANLTAGSAIIFDERTLHTALPNVSGIDRCTLTTRYAPFWVKQTGMVQSCAATLDTRGCLDTPVLRQLLGVEASYEEGRWFEPEYCNTHFRPDLR